MSGRRRLRGGLARTFPDHRSALAQAYRREYRAIVEELGITAEQPHLQREAGRVALLRVQAQVGAARWCELTEKRSRIRRRRPSPQALERASRRAHLDDHSASLALDKLRELARPRVKTPDEILDEFHALGAAERGAEEDDDAGA